jgi:PAS domain S-box-containing protein
MNSIYRRIFAMTILLGFVLVSSPSVAQTKVKRVLVLNAYHEGFHWTDRIMQGIRSVFDNEEDIELFVTYMDTKRSSDREYFAKLRDLYAYRYQALKFDAIVSSDDHALNFLLNFRDELFPDTPVFFCGINDFHPSRIAGHKSYTGVFETYDVPGTLDLMLQVHPEAKKIAVVTDATFSGNVFKQLVEKAEPNFVDRIEFNYLNNLGIGELKQQLGQLADDTLVLWAMYLRTPEGTSISSEESIRIVTTSSGRPTYCLWDVVGQGVIGGWVTSPNYQGKSAAEMALKFLRGGRIEDLPVSGSPMVHLFDFNTLRQFGIAEKSLPAGSIILNRPFSIYNEYKKTIWTVSCLVATLFIVILALIYYIRKRRQAEMEREHIFANAPVPMIAVNRRSKSLSFNNRFTESYGYTTEDFSNLDEWWGTVYPDAAYRKMVQNDWLQVDAEGGTAGSKIESRHREITCKRGLKHTVEYSRMVTGDIAVISMIDITKRITMETQLRQAQKMEAVGTMAGGIAHDFNNLLTIIIGNLNLIQRKLDKAMPVEENLGHIKAATDRAKDLVRQILTFSRHENPELGPAKLDPADLVMVISDTMKLLRSTIPTTVEIVKTFNIDTAVINADTTQLQQIIINVCTNAVHAMGEKGRLEIHLNQVELGTEISALTVNCQPGKYVQLAISDTGFGMDRETLDKIFDPFFTTKNIGEGTGMGLAVVHGIVERHGGFVSVESTPGQGTTFNFYFPTAQESEMNAEVGEESSFPTGCERILFVDDEKDIVDTYSKILEDLGYKVTSATSPGDALGIFKASPESFDLVVTDQSMPEMAGAELSRELLKIRADIAIILCTGYSAQISNQEAIRLGVREFCFKPMDIEQLATVTRKVLDERDT